MMLSCVSLWLAAGTFQFMRAMMDSTNMRIGQAHGMVLSLGRALHSRAGRATCCGLKVLDIRPTCYSLLMDDLEPVLASGGCQKLEELHLVRYDLMDKGQSMIGGMQ